MKIKILKKLFKLNKTYEKGSVIDVKDDGNGTPLDKYWRNRIKDSPIDECVKVLTKEEVEAYIKEQERLSIETENKAKKNTEIKEEEVENEIKIEPKEISEKKVIKNTKQKKVINNDK